MIYVSCSVPIPSRRRQVGVGGGVALMFVLIVLECLTIRRLRKIIYVLYIVLQSNLVHTYIITKVVHYENMDKNTLSTTWTCLQISHAGEVYKSFDNIRIFHKPKQYSLESLNTEIQNHKNFQCNFTSIDLFCL